MKETFSLFNSQSVVRLEFIRAFLVSLLLLNFIPETNELESQRHSLPFYNYRIKNDPKQVKPDKITNANLFSWLNLKNSVRFRLWTRKNPDLAHEIKYNHVESLLTSNFDSKRLTKIIIHGFADTATEVAVTSYLFDMRDAYLHLGDVNVFIIDYSLFTMPIFYYTSLVDLAAARLGEFIKFLLTNSNLRLSSLHFIGFSLGAQVAGLAGHWLNGSVGRITGLDPAGPGFHLLANELRLDKSDAKFVDIIHTNAGRAFLSKRQFGISEALGHVDFFPNGGSQQLGCRKTSIFNLSYKDLECSHGRAARYFIESITSPLAFPSCQCASLQSQVNRDCPCINDNLERTVYMGEHLDQSVHGIFELVTKSVSPFGTGPRIDVSLANVTVGGFSNIDAFHTVSSNTKKFVISAEQFSENVGILTHNQTQAKFRHRNGYNALDYPNNDVIEICHVLLRLNKSQSHDAHYKVNKLISIM